MQTLTADPRSPFIQHVAQTQDFCGEGAAWHPQHQSVYWTDINLGKVHRFHLPSTKVTSWHFDQPVTAVALTTDPSVLVVVLGGKVLLWSPDRGVDGHQLYGIGAWPQVRANDARVGPCGSLWLGTMQNNVASDGGDLPVTRWDGELLNIDACGNATVWQRGFGIPNTVAWSPDGRQMYIGDTLRNTIFVYRYDPTTRSLADPREFCRGFDRGLPDGSAVDSEGFLWNCRFGGACIVRFAPDGSVDFVLDTPVRNPTTCAFGGDTLTDLYFTSASQGSRTQNGMDGGLFRLRLPVAGLPANLFQLKSSSS